MDQNMLPWTIIDALILPWKSHNLKKVLFCVVALEKCED